jgi:uncharacterized protein (TIGR00255 family)
MVAECFDKIGLQKEIVERTMPLSMTAFATAHAKHDWGTLSWQARSLNHRYLEPNFRLPDTLNSLEMSLRDQMRKFVQRGKVDCTLRIESDLSQDVIDINVEVARKYISAGETIAKLIASPAHIHPMDIFGMQGVQASNAIDPESLKTAVLELYQQVMEQLVEARKREGDKLADFIRQRLADMTLHIEAIKSNMPQLLATQKKKLLNKLAELGCQLDHERLEQELVYLAQKADVDEELDRLEVHIAEIYRVLQSDKLMGRRLDFLMQEVNREANTISSKAFASSTTQSAVELKVLIEQMREQVQNLE